ncbi:MAG: GNAT family N-acetyltransferase [Caulobacter sp.]|nr:GNAT family N-acetyltransferase [Caulobacter sp.]
MLTLRVATLEDAGEVARLHRLSRRTAMPWLLDPHTPQEDLAFFREEVLASQRVVLAVLDQQLAGFAASGQDWLHHLYVHPHRQGCGVGFALLEDARRSGSVLRLWAFQRNLRARAFYERAGFSVVRMTDGSGNEEQEPDVLYLWRRAGATEN